jgi:hypothetical protein
MNVLELLKKGIIKEDFLGTNQLAEDISLLTAEQHASTEGFMKGFCSTIAEIEDVGFLEDYEGGLESVARLRVPSWPRKEVTVRRATSASSILVLNHIDNPLIKFKHSRIRMHEVSLDLGEVMGQSSLLPHIVRTYRSSVFMDLLRLTSKLLTIDVRDSEYSHYNIISNRIMNGNLMGCESLWLEIEFGDKYSNVRLHDEFGDIRNDSVSTNNLMELLRERNHNYWINPVVLKTRYINPYGSSDEILYRMPSHTYRIKKI